MSYILNIFFKIIFWYSSRVRIYQRTLPDFLCFRLLYCELSSTNLLVTHLLPCPVSSVFVSAHSCCIPYMFTVPCLVLWLWLQYCLMWDGLLYWTRFHKATYGHELLPERRGVVLSMINFTVSDHPFRWLINVHIFTICQIANITRLCPWCWG